MNAFVHWLCQRKLLNILFVIIYFLLVVLPHEQVGLFTVWVFKDLTRDAYNQLIMILGFVGLGIYAIPILNNIRKNGEGTFILFYLLCTSIFAILCFKLLIVINIEIIHFIQYGFMAILLFPLTMRYRDTLFWATILGAIDEAYQYFYLAPLRTDYYDFNDVIINLIGAAFGLIFIRSFGIGMTKLKKRTWLKSPIVWTSLLIGLGSLVLYVTGVLHLYPPEDGSMPSILLNRKPPSGFWSVLQPYVKYHVVLPIEGVLITVGLLLFYFPLDRFGRSI